MGIKVSITPGANSDSVADLAMTLMLAAARNVCPMDAAIRAGGHDKPITGVEMWNKTLGVVGTGRIGKGVIQRAPAFNEGPCQRCLPRSRLCGGPQRQICGS